MTRGILIVFPEIAGLLLLGFGFERFLSRTFSSSQNEAITKAYSKEAGKAGMPLPDSTNHLEILRLQPGAPGKWIRITKDETNYFLNLSVGDLMAEIIIPFYP